MSDILPIMLILAVFASCKPSTLKKPKKFYDQEGIAGAGVRLTEANLWDLAPKYDQTQLSTENIYISSFEVGSYPLVVISVPLMDIDFIKIKYCDIKTAICQESESSRPHTILNIPNQGTYQISVMTCLNKERSKTNTRICSSESTPYSFHQTHAPDPELDVLIAQSLESVSDYRKAGAKLYEAMEAFEAATRDCSDQPNSEYSERVRSFVLGGAAVLTDHLKAHSDQTMLKLNSEHPLNANSTTDTQVSQPDPVLSQLKNDRDAKEKEVQQAASVLWKKGILSLSGEAPDSKTPVEWTSLFQQAFEATGTRLSKAIFVDIEALARITSGIDSKRRAYLSETVEVSKTIEGKFLAQAQPDSDTIESLQSLSLKLKELREKFTKENWNHLGGYFELNWKKSREYLLAEEFDRSFPDLDSFMDAAKFYLSFKNLIRDLSILKSKIMLLEKQTSIQQEKAYSPIYTESIYKQGQPDSVNFEKTSDLYSRILLNKSEPLSILMRLRSIEMDIPDLAVQSNLSFRNRYFSLIYGQKHFLSISKNSEISLLMGVKDDSHMIPGSATGLNDWIPATIFSTASESQIKSIPVNNDHFSLLETYQKASGEAGFSSDLTSLKSPYAESGESKGSWIIKINESKFSHYFISDFLKNKSFLTPEAANLKTPEAIKNTENPDLKILSKLHSWEGPALQKGLSSLLNPDSEPLYTLGSPPKSGVNLNKHSLQSECYQSAFSELQNHLKTALELSKNIRTMEQANYSLMVNYFSK